MFLSFGVQYVKCILKYTAFNELVWFWGRLSKNQSEGSFTLSLFCPYYSASREREREMDYGCVGVWEAAVRECMGVKVKG